jgi:ABC-2 type transport system ATP-binding protein
MSSAIEIHALSKHYHTDFIAVDNLSLTVPAGQVLAFLGPNGAGKTTSIKMICGLIKPTSGSVQLNGFDVTKNRSQAVAQIGVVLEGTRNVYWRLPAWENLMYFGQLKGISPKVLRPRAEQLLRDFDLWERRHSEAGEFSRGMQQKLAIACALIADPPIIPLDEPTLGLDVQAARTVREQVQRLSAEQGKTIVITTHQLDMAQEICEQVAIINKGKLITNQPVQALLDVFQHEQYEIVIQGNLSTASIPQVASANIHANSETTTISGLSDDPHALNSLLNSIHQQGFTLLSVERKQPTLEDIFVELTAHETRTSSSTR